MRKASSRTSYISTVILILVGVFLYNSLNNILNAINIKFTGISENRFPNTSFSEVQFASPGNNFLGGIIWLPSISTGDVSIKLGSDTTVCKRQLRGIYYNAARGQRLWPLDEKTRILLKDGGQGYTNLSMAGGLYTACEGGGADFESIFGIITYNRGGSTTHIIGGTKLDYPANDYIGSFANSFQTFNNQTYLGYIYDEIGGIGFVGGSLSGHQDIITELNNGKSISDLFSIVNGNITPLNSGVTLSSDSGSIQDLMNNILGLSIFSKATSSTDNKLLGRTSNKPGVILYGSDINHSTLINIARESAEKFCGRGRTYFVASGSTDLGTSSDSVLCYKNTNELRIDLSDSSKYANKTIIVKHGNVTLRNSMQANDPALNLFIEQGNLYMSNTSPVSSFVGFNDKGYPSTTDAVNSGIYIKGNVIINGLLLGGSPGSETTFDHKLHIQGKVVLLNTPITPTQERSNQVTNLLGSQFTSWINLENTFLWQCQLSGNVATPDGTPCLGQTTLSTTPLVILDGNYSSPLFNK